MRQQAIRLFSGTPEWSSALRTVADAQAARPLLAGDPALDVAEFAASAARYVARDSGAPLNLDAVYVNSAEAVAASSDTTMVFAVAENRMLHLSPPATEELAEALRGAREVGLENMAPDARRQALYGFMLMLHEGGHVTGATFDDAAAAKGRAFGSAAAATLEEGLAELRVRELLPSFVRDRFGTAVSSQDVAAAADLSTHAQRAGTVARLLRDAADVADTPVDELTRRLAHRTAPQDRLDRLAELLPGTPSEALEAQLAIA